MFENPPVYAISSGSIIRYYECQGRGKKSLLAEKIEQNLTRGKFNGFISQATRKTLRKRLTEYYDAMYTCGVSYMKKNKIIHPILTLTLCSPQMHSDNEIKAECLNRFLTLMKEKYDVRFYYWVAEKQLNSNIHFHVLVDRFLDWQWVRKAWNNRLDALGYIDIFEQNHGHRDPNSTDIQLIKNLAKSADYVTKYTTKLDQQGGIEGRLHGMSDVLRQVDKFKPYGSHEFDLKMSEWIEQGRVRLFESEHAIGVYGDIRKLLKEECPKHFAEWKSHHRAVASLFYG